MRHKYWKYLHTNYHPPPLYPSFVEFLCFKTQKHGKKISWRLADCWFSEVPPVLGYIVYLFERCFILNNLDGSLIVSDISEVQSFGGSKVFFVVVSDDIKVLSFRNNGLQRFERCLVQRGPGQDVTNCSSFAQIREGGGDTTNNLTTTVRQPYFKQTRSKKFHNSSWI